MVNNLNLRLFNSKAIALGHSGEHLHLGKIKDISLPGCGSHRMMLKYE